VNIGKSIAYYRTNNKMSAVDLAQKSGLSQGSISMYENGKRNPSAKALGKIATALGVSVSDLFSKAQSYNGDGGDRIPRKYFDRDRELNGDKERAIQNIYRFNDSVIELTDDILLAINTKIFDLENNVSLGNRRKYSPVELTFENVINQFIYEHISEISFRLNDELERSNIDIRKAIDEINRNY
jgi:transcriptional regulator with XRE-family HTH domain